MSWALLIAFLAPAFWAMSNVIDAHVSNNLVKRPDTLVFFYSMTNFLVIPFLLLLGTPAALPIALIPYIFMGCLIEIVYQLPYFMALKRLETSISTALFSLGKIVTPLFAYIMVDETLSLPQYIGFVIIIVFNIILSFDPKEKFKLNTGFYLMLFVAIITTIQLVIYKRILMELDWISTLFYNVFFTMGIASFFLFRKACRQDVIYQAPRLLKRWKLFIANEAVGQMAQVAEIYAISLLPIVTFTGISDTQPLFVLLYGFLLYHLFKIQPQEKLSTQSILKKTICFIFIIGGIILVI